MGENDTERAGILEAEICHLPEPGKKEDTAVDEYKEGELIIYQNGDRYEIGKIKRLTPTGAFVWYSEGDTASKTPYEVMHKLTNAYTIKETALGGADKGR